MACSDISLATEDRMPFHTCLNLPDNRSLRLEISDKAKQEEKAVKAYYKDGQNQSNSST